MMQIPTKKADGQFLKLFVFLASKNGGAVLRAESFPSKGAVLKISNADFG